MSNFVGVAGVPGASSYNGVEPVSTNHGPLKTGVNHNVYWGFIEHHMKRLTLANTIKVGPVDGTASAGMVRWEGGHFQGYTGATWLDLDKQGTLTSHTHTTLDQAYEQASTITLNVTEPVLLSYAGTTTSSVTGLSVNFSGATINSPATTYGINLGVGPGGTSVEYGLYIDSGWGTGLRTYSPFTLYNTTADFRVVDSSLAAFKVSSYTTGRNYLHVDTGATDTLTIGNTTDTLNIYSGGGTWAVDSTIAFNSSVAIADHGTGSLKIPVSAGAPVGGVTQGRIVYDSSNNRLYTYDTISGWVYADVGTTGGGGGSLDYAYDFGGAGAGRTINADSGAVVINAGGTSTEGLYISGSVADLLELDYSGSGSCVDIYTSNANSDAISITAAGQGVVSHTSDGAAVQATTASGLCFHGIHNGSNSNSNIALLSYSGNHINSNFSHGLRITYMGATFNNNQTNYGLFMEGKTNAGIGYNVGVYTDSGWDLGSFSRTSYMFADGASVMFSSTIGGTNRGALYYYSPNLSIRLVSNSGLELVGDDINAAASGYFKVDANDYIDLIADQTSQFTVTDASQHLVIQTTGAASYLQLQATQGEVEINGYNLDLNAQAGAVTIDASTNISLDAATSSNFTVSSSGHTLTLAATLGAIAVTSGGATTITSGGSTNITSGGSALWKTANVTSGASSSTVSIRTGDSTVTTGSITVVSGQSSSSANGSYSTGSLAMGTAGAASSGHLSKSGYVQITTGDSWCTTGSNPTSAVTGIVSITTGRARSTTGAADSGYMVIKTGISDYDNSGYMDIETGAAAWGSGYMSIKTGDVSLNSASGVLNLSTGAVTHSAGNGWTGDTNVRTGNSTYHVSGNITVATGTSSASHASGSIYIQTGNFTNTRSGFIELKCREVYCYVPADTNGYYPHLVFGQGSVKFVSGSGAPSGTTGYSTGTLYLDYTNGNLYVLVSSTWKLFTRAA